MGRNINDLRLKNPSKSYCHDEKQNTIDSIKQAIQENDSVSMFNKN